MTATQLILVWIVVYVTPYSPLRIGQLADRGAPYVHAPRRPAAPGRSFRHGRSRGLSHFPRFFFSLRRRPRSPPDAARGPTTATPAARAARHTLLARGSFEFVYFRFCRSGLSVNQVSRHVRSVSLILELILQPENSAWARICLESVCKFISQDSKS